MSRVTLWLATAIVVTMGLLAGCQGQAIQGSRFQAVLQADPGKRQPWPKSEAAQQEMMQQAAEVISKRAAAVDGVSDVDVSVLGNSQLVLRYASDTCMTVDILHRLTSTAQLEFYAVSYQDPPLEPR